MGREVLVSFSEHGSSMGEDWPKAQGSRRRGTHAAMYESSAEGKSSGTSVMTRVCRAIPTRCRLLDG